MIKISRSKTHPEGFDIKLSDIRKPFHAKDLNEILLAVKHYYRAPQHHYDAKDCPICQLDKPAGHQLIIQSLHDAQATCTCGEWCFVGTGQRTAGYIRREYLRHITATKTRRNNSRA